MPHKSASLCVQGGKKRGALHSGLDIPEVLRDFWYPVEFSSKLRMGKHKCFSLFNQQWRLMRSAQGKALCLPDLSVDRSVLPTDWLQVIAAFLTAHIQAYFNRSKCFKVLNVLF